MYILQNDTRSIQYQINRKSVVMGVKEELQSSSSFTLITYRDITNCNIQHNAPEDGLLKSETFSATEYYE